jgi:hypothetical protein
VNYRILAAILILAVSWYLIGTQIVYAGKVGNVIKNALEDIGDALKSAFRIALNFVIAIAEIATFPIPGNQFFEDGQCRLKNLDKAVLGPGEYADKCEEQRGIVFSGAPASSQICSNALPVYFFNSEPVVGDEDGYSVSIYRSDKPITAGNEELAAWLGGIKQAVGAGIFDAEKGIPHSVPYLIDGSAGLISGHYSAANQTLEPIARVSYKNLCDSKGVCRFIDAAAPADRYVIYLAKLEKPQSARIANIIWYPITQPATGAPYIAYNDGRIFINYDSASQKYFLQDRQNPKWRYDTVKNIGGVNYLAVPDGALRGVYVSYPIEFEMTGWRRKQPDPTKGKIKFNSGYIKLNYNPVTKIYSVPCGSGSYFGQTQIDIHLGALENCDAVSYSFTTDNPKIAYNNGEVALQLRTEGPGLKAKKFYYLENKGRRIEAAVTGGGLGLPAATAEIKLPENFLDDYDIHYFGPTQSVQVGRKVFIRLPAYLSYNSGKILFDEAVNIREGTTEPALYFYFTYYNGQRLPADFYTPMNCYEKCDIVLRSNENPASASLSNKFLSGAANAPSVTFPLFVNEINRYHDKTVYLPRFVNGTAVNGIFQTNPDIVCPAVSGSITATSSQCTSVDLSINASAADSYDLLRNDSVIASNLPPSQTTYKDSNLQPHTKYIYKISAKQAGKSVVSAPAEAYTFCRPKCSFSADKPKVTEFETASLKWACQYADTCAISPDVGSVSAGGGSQKVKMGAMGNYNYILTCGNVDGSVNLPASIKVTKPGLIEVKP